MGEGFNSGVPENVISLELVRADKTWLSETTPVIQDLWDQVSSASPQDSETGAALSDLSFQLWDMYQTILFLPQAANDPDFHNQVEAVREKYQKISLEVRGLLPTQN